MHTAPVCLCADRMLRTGAVGVRSAYARPDELMAGIGMVTGGDA